jgi:hypothetical protein
MMSDSGESEGTLPAQAQQAAGATLASAKEGAAGVVDVAREQTNEVVGTAWEHAQHVTEETRDELRAHAAQQADRLAGTLAEISSQLDRMVKGQGAPEGMVRDLTQELASRATSAANRLQDGGYEGMVYDAKRLARNRPGLFLLGAMGAGVVAGRLLHHADRGALTDALKADKPEPDSAAPALPPVRTPAVGAGSPVSGSSSTPAPTMGVAAGTAPATGPSMSAGSDG